MAASNQLVSKCLKGTPCPKIMQSTHLSNLFFFLMFFFLNFVFGKVVIPATKVHYEAPTYNAHLRHLPGKSDLGFGGWGKHLQDEVPGAREDDRQYRAWLGR